MRDVVRKDNIFSMSSTKPLRQGARYAANLVGNRAGVCESSHSCGDEHAGEREKYNVRKKTIQADKEFGDSQRMIQNISSYRHTRVQHAHRGSTSQQQYKTHYDLSFVVVFVFVRV